MGTSTLTAFIQIQNNIQNKHFQDFVGNILTSCRTIQVSPSLKAATVFLPCVTSPHCLAEYCLWTLDWQDMLPNDCFRSYKIQESYPAMFDLTVITQQICQSQDTKSCPDLHTDPLQKLKAKSLYSTMHNVM